MDAEYYCERINGYDAQIDELKERISKTIFEIDEAEEAKNSSKGVVSDFNNFVSRKKQKISIQGTDWLINAFKSFVSKSTSLLNGTEYIRANEKLDEIESVINNKIYELNDKLNYYRNEISRLEAQRETMYNEYQNYISSEKEVD